MRGWSELAERVGGTTRTSEKTSLLARYLATLPASELRAAATFLAGRPFAEADGRSAGLGWATIAAVVSRLAEAPAGALGEAYDRSSDLGQAVADVLALRPIQPDPAVCPALAEVAEAYAAVEAAPFAAAKSAIFAGLLGRCDALTAKYTVKILTGELRIGLREGLLEAAIAEAFDRPQAAVGMALMLTGDTGETAVLAKENRLDEARLCLLHPIKFMLASPAEDAADILGRLGPTVWVEDKYDGIRAQLHRRGSEVRLYSRDLHDISGQFPEIVEAAGPLDWDGILDGEILAYADGHVLPFLTLQGRLGRKDPSAHVQSEVPVVYVAFDLLAIGPRSAYVNGSLNGHHPLEPGRSTFTAAAAAADGTGRGVMGAAAVIDVAGGTGTAGAPDHSPGHSTDSSARVRGNGTSALLPLLATPLAERRGRLEALGLPTIAEGGRFALSHLMTAGSAETLDGLFGEARGRRNEGLMVKDPNSGYSPGRRGLGWLKMKRALATLDCVVVGVEAGHGKRHGVLSDYTFAVRDDSGERLVTIGKAYTGLTDAEIAEMTRWFEAHTIAQYGRYRQVEPTAVVEVAFDVIQRSNRHQSGFALRFPRIVGLRMDKSPTEIDTLATVERLHRELQYGAEYLVTAEAKHTRSRPAGTV